MVYNIVLKYTMMFCGRNPNGNRTETEGTANGIRPDSGRSPVSRDLVSFQTLYNIRLVPHCCLRHYVVLYGKNQNYIAQIDNKNR